MANSHDTGEIIARSLRIRMFAVGFLLVAGLGCDSGGEDTPRNRGDTTTTKDTAMDVGGPEDGSDPDMNDSGPPRDTGDDTSRDGGGDTSVDPVVACRSRVGNSLQDFQVVSQNRAVEVEEWAEPGGGEDSGKVPCGAVALLDTDSSETESSPSVSVMETREYPQSMVFIERFQQKLVVLSLKFSVRFSNSQWERNLMKNMVAEVFDVQNDRFRRISRNEHLVTPPQSEDFPSLEPNALVSNSDKLVLATGDRIFEFGLNNETRVVLEQNIDRSSRYESLSDQLSARTYDPFGAFSYHLTEEGYLLESENGLSVWDTNAPSAGDSFVDYFPIPVAVSGRDRVSAYSEQASVVFLLGDEDAPPDAPENVRPVVHVLDVSDPTSLSQLGTWGREAFDISPAGFSNLGPMSAHAKSGRLYIIYSAQNERGVRVLSIFDVSADPTAPNLLANPRDLGGSPRREFAIFPHDDRLFYTLGIPGSMSDIDSVDIPSLIENP